MGRFAHAFGLLSALVAAGCVPPAPPEGVVGCPLLVVGGGRASYGALVAMPGAVAPASCVALWEGGRVISEATATREGTFALQFQVDGDARGRRFELTVQPTRGAPGDRYSVTFSPETGSLLMFEPGTAPVVARSDGTIELHAWLSPPPAGAAPMESAAVINWRTGAVEPVLPPPPFEVRLDARVRGVPGDCIAAISTHDARGDRTGGCWWPMGGGGCAPLCTLDALTEGSCVFCGTPEIPCPPCTMARGCSPLVVDERWVDIPPPERDDTVPAGLPDAGPRDGGPPDAGPIDAGPQPDAEPF